MNRLLFICVFMVLMATSLQNANCQQPCDVYSFAEVEVKPSYNGDIYLFLKWVSENLHYPKDIGEMCFQGRVMVEFIVDEDGLISNVTVKHGLHPSLDAEVVRVISMSPKWSPGMIDGKRVKTRLLFPVSFRFE